MTGLDVLEELRKDDFENDSLHLNRLCLYSVIQKSLQALEIIKYKRVNVDNFLNNIKKDTNYKEYKRLCGLYKIMVFSEKDLTKQEFELLKEVLC